jgi:pimeloyl-ACP methyl ester carboxylesterase
MPFLTASDGCDLFFSDWGDPHGRPVVFAHAWALSGDMWNQQIPDLVEAGLRCVVYDRRGHGRSDRPGRGYDLDTLAADLAALLDHLQLTGRPTAALVPASRLVVIEGAGHGLYASAAARYNDEILHFISACAPKQDATYHEPQAVRQ